MSRRSVTRAVCAPLAIALVTTAIPPAISNHIAINLWTTKALSATLAVAGDGIGRLGTEFDKHAQEGSQKIGHVREQLATQLSAATDAVVSGVDATYTRAADAISSGTDAALARIDSWMTSVSESVIAMLPSSSNEPVTVAANPTEIQTPANDGLQKTASLSIVAAIPAISLPNIEVAPTVAAVPAEAAPAPELVPVPTIAAEPETPALKVVSREPVSQIEKIEVPAPAIQPAQATFDPVETVTAMLAPTAHAAVPAEIKTETRAAPISESAALPIATPASAQAELVLETKAVAEEKPPIAEAIVALETAPAVKSKPQEIRTDEKLVIASLNLQIDRVEPEPLAEAAPPVDFKTQETKAEEKLVVASLGRQTTAIDVPAPEFKAAPESSPSEIDTSSNRHVIDPLQMTNVPMSAPLKIRALTRADIPGAEKHASLGPSAASDARKLPPEEQRVAYDAPAEAETPISIGRRRWTEEAAKYQGLGSPEALLEALKHMGAGAKSLGLPASLWCADFMNLVLRKSGVPATGSRAAKSYLQYGKKIDEPRVGAIAIFSRGKNGGHIGIVRGTDGKGNPIIVSGNHNNKVAEAIYPKERVLAYVVPR